METDVLTQVSVTITTDATIQSLTGASVSDPRWYFYHRANVLIDATHPAYMTYLLTASPESSMGVSPNVVSVIIWGKTRAAVLAVRDRMVALFNKQDHVSASARKFHTRIVNEQDTYSDEANFVGRQMAIRVAYLG